MTFKKVGIRITQVPNGVEQLFGMCTAAGVEYRGEGAAAVAQSIYLRSVKKPRRDFTLVEKNGVRERQKDLCECGEELGDSPELDHIQPLAQGGSDSIDIVEFKCSTCHLTKTELERLGGMSRHNPLASVMSRDLLEQFTMSPTPPQLLVGKVKEGDLGLDVIACRRSAIYNNNLRLPRFNLLDKPQVFDPRETYHYYYVDAGQVTTVEELYERLPYTGPGWH